MKKCLILMFVLLSIFIGVDNSVRCDGSGDSWLIMLYQDADDYSLEEDIVFDLNEAEYADSSDMVTIVSQLDRFDGGFDGDGDWHSTRRYLLSSDNDMGEISSSLIQDLGEANMADGDTLAEFCIWAIENYPADKYALIMSDHGSGWPGGWSDPEPYESDMLWVAEMGDAMERVLSETGLDSMDLIGFDACLMGHLEVYASMQPYFDYAVASQETEPGIGWAYNAFIQELVDMPSMDGEALAKKIVETYIYSDLTVEGYSFSEISEYLGGDITLSAIDLSALETFRQSFNTLLVRLQEIDQAEIARARSYAQSFTNIFDESLPSPYIDLGHFLSLLKNYSGDSAIKSQINDVLIDYKAAVISETHGKVLPGSTGISIHFPNSELYTADWGGMESYTYSVPNFLRTYNWDEFLQAHYTGIDFVAMESDWVPSGDEDEYITVPEDDEEIIAPGYGVISIENLTVDQSEVTGDGVVLMSAEIIGDNIAYIYIEVLYYDEDSGYYLVADRDYIEADDTKENSGVYYPDWSTDEGAFELEFEWEPYLFAIDDGQDYTFALLEPHAYGLGTEDTIYTVEGSYYTAAEDDDRYAVCYFNGEGSLNEIYGFSGNFGLGAPHEIKPKTGDSFAPYESWVIWDDDGEPEYDYELGEYLTINNLESPLEWYDEPAFTGPYYLAFSVEDFDGNQVTEYIYVEVLE